MKYYEQGQQYKAHTSVQKVIKIYKIYTQEIPSPAKFETIKMLLNP